MWTRDKFARLLGDSAVQILAAFAFGGVSGMPVEAAASLLGYAFGEVQECMAMLAAGGVVEETGQDALAVYPEPLRCVLTRNYFFERTPRLPLDRFLQRAPNRGSAVRTLVGAYARGASISSRELLRLVESTKDDETWRYFTWCDASHADLILDHHPERLLELAEPLLYGAPERSIPLLFARAVDDERELHAASNHPLRVIDDWVRSGEPGTPEALQRRSVLIDAACAWLQQDGDQHVGFTALHSGLSPHFEDHHQEPGKAHTFSFRLGMLTREQTEELACLWPHIVDVLSGLVITDWGLLIQILDEWRHPGRGPADIAPDTLRVCHATAPAMLRDLARLARGHPGVTTELAQRARESGIELDSEVCSDFAALFPEDPIHGSENDYQESLEQQAARAQVLANDWATKDPKEVASRLAWCVHEAIAAGHGWPDYTAQVCRQIAERTGAALPYVDAFLMEGSLSAEHVGPFLERAAGSSEEGWQERAERCLGEERLCTAGVSVILQSQEVESSLYEQAVEQAQRVPKLIESLCIRGRLSPDCVLSLLQSNYCDVAAAAARGVWHCEPRGEVEDGLEAAWREAVVRHVRQEHFLRTVLQADEQLAFAWLMEHAQHQRARHYGRTGVLSAAASALPLEKKRELLRQVREVIGAEDVVRAVVGDDADLYAELLADADHRYVHLAPLMRGPDLAWAELAARAMDAGYSAEDCVNCTFRMGGAYCGRPSTRYEGQAEAWATLEVHDDSRVRRAAQLARGVCQAQQLEWQQRERRDDLREYYT